MAASRRYQACHMWKSLKRIAHSKGVPCFLTWPPACTNKTDMQILSPEIKEKSAGLMTTTNSWVSLNPRRTSVTQAPRVPSWLGGQGKKRDRIHRRMKGVLRCRDCYDWMGSEVIALKFKFKFCDIRERGIYLNANWAPHSAWEEPECYLCNMLGAKKAWGHLLKSSIWDKRDGMPLQPCWYCSFWYSWR